MPFRDDAIYWVDASKIRSNPYQPRRVFDSNKLAELADSIRQYGVLQPLVVTRREIPTDDGGMVVEYELIAGERRLRAAGIAGVSPVPVIVRSDDEDEIVKLELAIIENLQREDLNPIDRARAFIRLVNEFKYKHGEVARKIGRSREYVSNTIRMLQLPEEMSDAIAGGRITEGHSRPLLMLSDRPEEQITLFKEMLFKKMTVRDAEQISRRIAHDRIRDKKLAPKPEILEFEEQASESLGTRVQIRQQEVGGKVVIDYTSEDDLTNIINFLRSKEGQIPRADGENEEPMELKDPEPQPEGVPDEQGESRVSDEDDEVFSLDNFSI